jgi:hypothetical protein
MSEYPTIRGGKAAPTCKGCGTDPVWGAARDGWWMTCDCWQSITGTPAEVQKYWTRTKQEREKAKKP